MKGYFSGAILEGDLGEKVSLSWLTSPYLELREKWKCIKCIGEILNLDQNFSLKSWNFRKTSPSLKALGWPLTSENFCCCFAKGDNFLGIESCQPYIWNLSNSGLLLMERFCFQREQTLSFKSSPNEKGDTYFQWNIFLKVYSIL